MPSFKNTEEEIAFCLEQVNIYSNRATQLLKKEKEGVSTSSSRKDKKKSYLTDDQKQQLFRKAIS